MVTKEKIERFYKDVDSLGLKFPVAAITKATGYVKGNVSDYLSKKKEPSENFIHAFYKAFEGSIKVPRETNGDLSSLIRNLTEAGIKHEAAINILVISLAEMIAQQTGKGIGFVSSELQKAISLESDRLLIEREKKGQ